MFRWAAYAVAFLAHLALSQSTESGGNTAAFNTWASSTTAINQPTPRGFHSAQIMTSSCRSELMVVFGGLEQGPLAAQVSFLNSTWFLDLSLLQWYPLGPEIDELGPSSRAGHSAVIFGGQYVVFAGRNAQRVLNDTWAFTLDFQTNCTSREARGSWEQLQVTCSGADCPPPRLGHVAAHLNFSNSMYIFGGCNSLETAENFSVASYLTLVDTRVFRLAKTLGGGYSWRVVAVEAPRGLPPARFGAASAAISEDSIFVVSGCSSAAESLQDAWLFTVLTSDGLSARWTPIQPILRFNPMLLGSPFVSFGSALSMHPDALTTVGGTTSPPSLLQDLDYFPQVNATVFLWLVNVTNASASVEVKLNSPYGQTPNAPACTTALETNGTIIVFGGIDPCTALSTNQLWTQPASDASCLFISQAPWVPLQLRTPPTDGTFAGLSTLDNGNIAFLFGGRGLVYPSSIAPELWTYNLRLNVWRQLRYDSSVFPVNRYAHVQATLLNSIFIFGGGHHQPNGMLELLNDMWMWEVRDDEGNGHWVSIASSGSPSVPSPRYSAASATFNSSLLFVHGGDNGATVYNDLWMFDALSRAWTPITTGPTLTGHNALFLSGVLHLFFGRTGDPSVDQSTIHRFDMKTRTFSTLPLSKPWPPARAYAAAAMLSSALGRAVFYGGHSAATGNFGDMWTYDVSSSSWTALTLPMPIRQRAMQTLYVPSTSQLISIGGSLQQASTMAFITLGCNPGYYSADFSTVSCAPCAQGTYSAAAGAVSCTSQCPANLFTPMTGAVSLENCTVCQPGVCNGHGTCRVLAANNPASGRYECKCTGWYRYSESDDCSTPIVAIIVLTVLFSAALAACIVAYCRHSQRNRKALVQDYELKVRLLDDAEEGLREYERVWDINFDDLKLGELIAQGSFGAVHRGKYNDNDVAVKMLRDVYVEAGMPEEGNFSQENRMLRTLRHRNILFFYGGGVNSSGVPFIVVEFMSRGTVEGILHDTTISDAQLPFAKRIQFLLDCAEGMRFLHERTPPLIHRDLKSSNLLVSDAWVVKVSDFGTAQLKKVTTRPKACKRSASLRSAGKAAAEPEAQPDDEPAFTLLWAAPEALQRQPFNSSVDVFSFGIVMWEMFTRKLPYEDIKRSADVADFVIGGGRPDHTGLTLPLPVRSLMIECWSPHASARPTFGECCVTLRKFAE